MARSGKLNFKRRRIRGFTGNQLKLIACFCMLCDHIAYILIENVVLYGQNPDYWELAIATAAGHRWYLLARFLRTIGRISFPIFAYLLVEGFRHTRNLKHYLRNVFLCALASEVPFDLACFQTVFYPQYQNVCFTLFLGLLSMTAMRNLGRGNAFLQLLIGAFFCGIGYLIRCDYGALGVGLISVLWILRLDQGAQRIIGIVISAIDSVSYFCMEALAFLPLYFYNGRRGAESLKYLFYLFYPLHLLVLYLLAYLGTR